MTAWDDRYTATMIRDLATSDDHFAVARAALDGARSILRAEVEELLREWESDETHLDHRSGLRIAAAQLREVIDAGPALAPEDESAELVALAKAKLDADLLAARRLAARIARPEGGSRE
jgi:hypothetical protein